jgi:hypothetical protein
MSRPLTLNEVCDVLNDLVDDGYGHCQVYARDYFIRDPDEIKIEKLLDVDYVCIGDA